MLFYSSKWLIGLDWTKFDSIKSLFSPISTFTRVIMYVIIEVHWTYWNILHEIPASCSLSLIGVCHLHYPTAKMAVSLVLGTQPRSRSSLPLLPTSRGWSWSTSARYSSAKRLMMPACCCSMDNSQSGDRTTIALMCWWAMHVVDVKGAFLLGEYICHHDHDHHHHQTDQHKEWVAGTSSLPSESPPWSSASSSFSNELT